MDETVLYLLFVMSKYSYPLVCSCLRLRFVMPMEGDIFCVCGHRFENHLVITEEK